MNDQVNTRRRKVIATLIVALPLLAGLVIAALAYFIGGEGPEVGRPHPQARPRLVEAAAPQATGSPAPRVRLAEGGGGRFDSASLGREPYAVMFVSTRCRAIGGLLRRVAADLKPGDGVVLAISADPAVDSPAAVRRWLSRSRLEPGGPVHFLIGDAGELRRYWHAWGFAGPTARCPGSVPVDLVSGAGRNAGILDVAPDSPAYLVTGALRGMAR